MVRPFEDGLAMHQLRYPDEIKPWDQVPLGKLPKPAPAELHLAQQIVSQLESDEFHADRYKDEVKGRVRELIAKKAKGGEIVAPPEAPKPEVTDLMAALKASLAGGGRATAADGHGGSHRKHANGHRKHANGHKRTKHASRARPAAHRSHRSSKSHRRAHR
jgi:non-homologous end joining protein Ku